jgi:phosphatidylglycerophosphate synthase
MIRHAVLLASRSGTSESVRRLVAGVPLVKRAIIVLARAGLEQIAVIVEPGLGAELAADPELRALTTTIVYAGADLAAARPHVEGPFVVARADTVFDVGLAKLAAAADLGDAELVACGVLSIARPAVLDSGSLAATTSIDIGEALSYDASTPEALRRAEDALFKSLGKRTDGPVSRLINRPVSTFVTRRLVGTNVTPNQMTVVANVIGALGVVLVFQGTWAMLALGSLLVQLQSILDGCDGEIARLKFKSSKIGEWLDNVLDDQVNVGFGIALGFAATALTGQWWWTWVGVGAGAAFMVHNLVFYAQLAFVHRSGNPFNFRWWFEKPGVDVTSLLSTPTLMTRIGGLFRALVRRDVFLFAFLGLGVAGLPQIAVSWYAAIAASQFVLIALHVASGGFRKR